MTNGFSAPEKGVNRQGGIKKASPGGIFPTSNGIPSLSLNCPASRRAGRFTHTCIKGRKGETVSCQNILPESEVPRAGLFVLSPIHFI